MIAWLAFHWHRFREWRHQILAARHFALGRQHHDRAIEHGRLADRSPPPEWKRRLWARDHDPRSEEQDRRS